jgi:hypothetical protein
MQTAEDLDSQDEYEIRSYERTDFKNALDIDVLFLAERYLAASKDSRIRIDSVTITGVEDPLNADLNRLLWDTQYGDRLSVEVRTGHGWSYVKDVQVFGISHRITAEDWTATFRLDDAQAALQLGREFLVPKSEPEAWWKFNDGDITTDAANNGHKLTWTSAPTNSASGGPAEGDATDGYVTLDGTDDFATVASEADLEIVLNVSFEMWVRPHDAAGTFQTIAAARASGGTLWEIVWHPDNSRFLFFSSITGSGFSYGIGPTANEWHHIVTTVTLNADASATIRNYLNGNLKVSTTNNGLPPGGPYTVNIGRKPVTNDQYFDGDLSEFTFWQRVLAPSEILDLYNSRYG